MVVEVVLESAVGRHCGVGGGGSELINTRQSWVKNLLYIALDTLQMTLGNDYMAEEYFLLVVLLWRILKVHKIRYYYSYFKKYSSVNLPKV